MVVAVDFLLYNNEPAGAAGSPYHTIVFALWKARVRALFHLA